jgi:glycosyltransferase involved in cell wall biosynthesis
MGLLRALPPPPPAKTGWPWTEETSAGLFHPPPNGGWPRLSIVCPSFRQGRYIEETIRSVVLQNYPALEFIVIDGGSDDNTVPILKKYSPWLTYWESASDHGQAHAINKGCAKATGEIIGWINSDDYYLPGGFAAVGRTFRRAARSLIYGDWCERQDEEPTLITHHEYPAFGFQIAVGGRHLPSHATFWPAAEHQPANEALRFTMDADLFKRLAASGLKPVHIAQPLGVFRRHAEAKTTLIADIARAESEAWSRAQPPSTHWRWVASRTLDRVRRAFSP